MAVGGTQGTDVLLNYLDNLDFLVLKLDATGAGVPAGRAVTYQEAVTDAVAIDVAALPTQIEVTVTETAATVLDGNAASTKL